MIIPHFHRMPKALVSIGLAALVLIPLIAAPSPEAAGQQCGTERWSVKTGTDPDAPNVDLSNILATSIPEMAGWPKPSSYPANNRIAPYEFIACWYYAFVVQYKRETDSDYHIVMADYQGNTMVAEIPDPACVGSDSPFYDYIVNARAEFDSMFTVTTSWHYTYTPVLITGVAFFDIPHNQTGHSPNYIELHPILDIQFL